MDTLKNINPSTALVASIGIIGVCVLAYLRVDQEVVAGYAAALVTAAAAMEKLFPKATEVVDSKKDEGK